MSPPGHRPMNPESVKDVSLRPFVAGAPENLP